MRKNDDLLCEFNVIQIKWHKQQPTILTVKIVDYQILYGVNELKNQIRVTPIRFFFSFAYQSKQQQ